MEKFKKVSDIELSLLYKVPSLAIYDGQVFMNDNLKADWPNSNEVFSFLPARMRFTSFILCRQGTVKVRVAMKEFLMKRNDLFMISDGTIVEKIEISADYRGAGLSLAAESPIVKYTNRSMRYLRRRLFNPEILSLSESQGERMVAFFSSLRHMIVFDSEIFKEEGVEGGLLMLISYLSAKLVAGVGVTSLSDDKVGRDAIVQRFISEIGQHYTEERGIAFYAEKLCLSTKYFAKVILDETGRYAKDWIKDFVIKDAKTMLASGNYTVQEVSDSLHFANQSFFGKYFKSAVGCSPREFQKNPNAFPSKGHESLQEEQRPQP